MIITDFNFKIMRLNNNDMLVVFDLSKGAGKAREELDKDRLCY